MGTFSYFLSEFQLSQSFLVVSCVDALAKYAMGRLGCEFKVGLDANS